MYKAIALSIRLCNRILSISFLLESSNARKYCLWPEGVTWLWPEVICAHSKITGKKSVFCVRFTSFVRKTLEVPISQKDYFGVYVCHDLDPVTFVVEQVFKLSKMHEFCLGHILIWKMIILEAKTWHKYYLWSKTYVLTLNLLWSFVQVQGHLKSL